MQERRQRHQSGRGNLGSLGGREHQCVGPVKEGRQNVVRTGGGEVLPRVSKGRGGAGTGSGGRLQWRTVVRGGAGVSWSPVLAVCVARRALSARLGVRGRGLCRARWRARPSAGSFALYRVGRGDVRVFIAHVCRAGLRS